MLDIEKWLRSPGGINAATKSNDAPDAAPARAWRAGANDRKPALFSADHHRALAGLAAAAVIEAPKAQTAQKYLGAKVSGPNYTVKPTVRSDGVMRIFEVDTSYGKFTFDGVEFTKLRLHELEAAAAIEKMSQSEAFGQAFGRAALGPIKFGADLITKPADTVERSLSGIGNMLDRVGAGLSNTRADRDNVMESLLGVSDTQRQLAVELDVDPYTDFPPLAERLKQMAGAMAGGGLPVRAGLASFPAVSGSPFHRSRAWTLRRIACATRLPRRSSPKPSRPWRRSEYRRRPSTAWSKIGTTRRRICSSWRARSSGLALRIL